MPSLDVGGLGSRRRTVRRQACRRARRRLASTAAGSMPCASRLAARRGRPWSDLEHRERSPGVAAGPAARRRAPARRSRRAGRRRGACRGCRSRPPARPGGSRRRGQPAHDLGAEAVVAEEQVADAGDQDSGRDRLARHIRRIFRYRWMSGIDRTTEHHDRDDQQAAPTTGGADRPPIGSACRSACSRTAVRVRRVRSTGSGRTSRAGRRRVVGEHDGDVRAAVDVGVHRGDPGDLAGEEQVLRVGAPGRVQPDQAARRPRTPSTSTASVPGRPARRPPGPTSRRRRGPAGISARCVAAACGSRRTPCSCCSRPGDIASQRSMIAAARGSVARACGLLLVGHRHHPQGEDLVDLGGVEQRAGALLGDSGGRRG